MPVVKLKKLIFSTITDQPIVKLDWIKGPLKGEATLKVSERKIIVPPGEAVMLISSKRVGEIRIYDKI